MPDRMSVVVTWRDRIGGPNAISFAAWAWLLPWGVWTTVAFQPVWNIRATLSWTLVGIAAHVATGIALLVARRTYLDSSRRPARPFAAVATFAIAGCARGATVGSLSVAMGLSPASHLSFRVPAGAVLTIVWFVIATATVDTVRRHGAILAALQQHRAQLEATRQRTNAQLLHWRQRLVHDARIALRAAFNDPSGTSDAPAHERLRTIADDVVRPLSHRVAQRAIHETVGPAWVRTAAVEHPRRPWIQHVQRAVLETPFPLALPTVVTTLTGAPLLLYVTQSPIGLAIAAMLGAVVFLMYSVADLLIRRTATSWRPVVRLSITVGVWLWTAWAIAHILVSVDGVTTIAPSAFFAAMGSVVGMTLVGALIASFEQHRQRGIDQLRGIVAALHREGDYLNRQLEHERDRLVRMLHGGVHARITGLAMQLAATEASEGSFDELAETLLRQCLQELAAPVDEPIEARLNTVCDVWRVVMHVELHLDATAQDWLDNDPVAASNVVEVVREALANAARHARAARADVSIRTATDSRIGVNIWDNGYCQSPPGESRSGLGTEILNHCAAQWELVRGSGATLQAQIDVRARFEAVG